MAVRAHLVLQDPAHSILCDAPLDVQHLNRLLFCTRFNNSSINPNDLARGLVLNFTIFDKAWTDLSGC